VSGRKQTVTDIAASPDPAFDPDALDAAADEDVQDADATAMALAEPADTSADTGPVVADEHPAGDPGDE
jgi:hypothetical protein